MLSFSGKEKKIAEKIKFNFKLDGRSVNLKKFESENEMVLTLEQSFKRTSDFEVCLTSSF